MKLFLSLVISCTFSFLHFLPSQSQSIAVSAFSSRTICDDGTVVSWGENSYGQLGDGTTNPRNVPGSVLRLSNITALYTSNRKGFALKDDGTVWAWGMNMGQLGDGTTETRKIPVQLNGLSNVKKLSPIPFNGAFVILDDGTLWGWGSNSYGIIGDGTTIDRIAPVQVSGISDVIQVEPASRSTFALKADGTVWAWGGNEFGQLGDGTTTDRHTPVQVTGLDNIIEIKFGFAYGCVFALKEDGTVWAWGRNNYGLLGDGTTTDRHTPAQIDGLADIVQIITNGFSSFALRNDGTVWAWGNNNRGQLGDGTTIERHSPVQVNGLSRVIEIGGNYALKDDGTLWMWGVNNIGQLGDGTTIDRHSPVKIEELSNFIEVLSIGNRVHVLKEDGSLWAWGSNNAGQLGDGTNEDRYSPVEISLYDAPEQPETVTGISEPDPGSTQTYSTDSLGSNMIYEWHVPKGWTILSGQGDTSIIVNVGDAAGEICVNTRRGCALSKPACMPVRPVFTLGQDTTLCNGDTLVLDPVLLPGEEIEWSTGSSDEKLHVTTEGIYSVIVTSETETFTDTIEVSFAPRPIVYVGEDKAFCGEVDYLIEPETNGVTYQWSTGDTTKNLYVDEEGLYWLRVESDFMCANADTIEILEIGYPYGFENSKISECDSVVLDAGNSGASYRWSNGDTTQMITVHKNGQYSVVINNGFCETKDEVHVTILPEIECKHYIWTPNAFSPNNDGLNDEFKPVYNKVMSYKLTIYNRWGSRIFQSNNPEKGWDGTHNGEIAEEGVYIYTLRYKYEEDGKYRTVHTEGSIHLIK